MEGGAAYREIQVLSVFKRRERMAKAKGKRSEAIELVSYGGKFHFEDLKIRKLRNGNMVRVVIETPFAGDYGRTGKTLREGLRR